MAIDRDASRREAGDGFLGAFGLADLHLPDFDRPASSGTPDRSALDAIAEEVDPLAATFGAQVFEPGTDSGLPRVTRLDYGRHLRVLLVESNDEQADAFSRAAAESVLDVHVERVDSIEATLNRLERSGVALLRKALPDVIVVSLPTAEAHHLLELMQLDERFDAMPIIVLNETSDPAAERRAFSLGATAHLVTPRRDYERVALMHALPDFIPRARAVHAHLESHRR